MATGVFDLIAAFAAIFRANAVFPIAGRAAISIKSEPCNPAVLSSKSTKPVGTPVIFDFWLYSSSSFVKLSINTSFIGV